MVLQSLCSLLLLRNSGEDEASHETLKGKKVTGVELTKSADCVFCRVSLENGFDVVWEDGDFTVFRDYNPSAVHHLQVIPKKHIESVKVLQKSDVELVKTMGEIGHRILDSLDVPISLRRLGFHIPPYNSIGHLHLHVQALPYKSTARKWKYPVAAGRRIHSKGFSWFVTCEQTINILDRGGRVNVFPC
ncbi:HIT-like protein [Neolentinus lepideus HHB14362 ss-1]|uniref:HIT-like protein n=1 Tax=Neolentinus lepideus HHB14362 ss-1 TaxID=1314782 RepID=A0A165VK24_9AGAM|nr:HIT-like protein [Neolentinus lepideus HHB14362 ss-1]